MTSSKRELEFSSDGGVNGVCDSAFRDRICLHRKGWRGLDSLEGLILQVGEIGRVCARGLANSSNNGKG